MEFYQFDKPTENIFRFICENPKANLLKLESLHDDFFKPPKKRSDSNNIKYYGDYAKTCTDYLLECGLIYSKEERIYTYFYPSAKGIAYAKFRRKNWILHYLPYFASVTSLIISLIALFR